MKEPQQRDEVQAASGRTNWTTIALIGFLVLLAAVAVFFATRGNSDQDKLTNEIFKDKEQLEHLRGFCCPPHLIREHKC